MLCCRIKAHSYQLLHGDFLGKNFISSPSSGCCYIVWSLHVSHLTSFVVYCLRLPTTNTRSSMGQCLLAEIKLEGLSSIHWRSVASSRIVNWTLCYGSIVLCYINILINLISAWILKYWFLVCCDRLLLRYISLSSIWLYSWWSIVNRFQGRLRLLRIKGGAQGLAS
jgi:hypothetical protein